MNQQVYNSENQEFNNPSERIAYFILKDQFPKIQKIPEGKSIILIKEDNIDEKHSSRNPV